MRFLVSADNPGGTNAILSVVKTIVARGDQVTSVLGGRAIDTFQEAGLSYIDYASADHVTLFSTITTARFDIFLFGTSLGKTVEKELLAKCKQEGVLSVCVLDSWVNYWQRFGEAGDVKVLPDYLCVMDQRAITELTDVGFPSKRLIITGNPYFDDFIDGITTDQEDKERVLFVSQPLRQVKLEGGNLLPYDEFSVLEDLISVYQGAATTQDINVVVRLHPREASDKFANTLSAKMLKNFTYDNIKNVKESISRSSLIVGINSMVLLQAALAGKKVISYQPGLMGTDILISNSFNLSKLVATKEELFEVIKQFCADRTLAIPGSISAKGQRFVREIKNKFATSNVVKFIDTLKKYDK